MLTLLTPLVECREGHPACKKFQSGSLLRVKWAAVSAVAIVVVVVVIVIIAIIIVVVVMLPLLLPPSLHSSHGAVMFVIVVVFGWSTGMEQSATRDSGLFPTYNFLEGDQVSPFPSVIWLTCTVRSDRQLTSVLSCATILDLNFVKVPRNCCDVIWTSVVVVVVVSNRYCEICAVCVSLRMLWWSCCVERRSTSFTAFFHSTTLAFVILRCLWRRQWEMARRALTMTSCWTCLWSVHRSVVHSWLMPCGFTDKVHYTLCWLSVILALIIILTWWAPGDVIISRLCSATCTGFPYGSTSKWSLSGNTPGYLANDCQLSPTPVSDNCILPTLEHSLSVGCTAV